MKKIFSSTFVIILTIILSFSLYKIIIWIRENKQNYKIINEVSESISTVQDNNKIDNTINYNVNFDKLKLINPDCKKCEATLEINLDKLQAFCPYCGSRLMIDVDKFDSLFKEMEITKREQIRETEKTKRAKYEYLSKVEDAKNYNHLILIFLIAAFMAMISVSVIAIYKY